MKKKTLFMVLSIIVLASAVCFKIGYNDSARTMVKVFESSKDLFSHQRSIPADSKFAMLTDSHVENLGGNSYKVDSYVDSQNTNQITKRVWYSMTVHWNGSGYTLDKLTTNG